MLNGDLSFCARFDRARLAKTAAIGIVAGSTLIGLGSWVAADTPAPGEPPNTGSTEPTISICPPVYSPGGPVFTPCVAKAKASVNASYASDPLGDYWLMRNWLAYPAADGDKRADTDDQYNFTEACSPPPVNQQTLGPWIGIADPSIVQVEDWFYVTGTSAEYHAANFPIYRTQDFAHFELHMLAFAPDDEGVRSEQYIDESHSPWRLYLNDRDYENTHVYYEECWAPQIYKDRTLGDSDPWIFLSFTAIETAFPQTGSPPSTPGRGDHHSVYLVKMRQSKFVQWHSISSPRTSDGPRFADARDGNGYQSWYGYTRQGSECPASLTPWLYDGGYAVGRHVPGSGSISLLCAGAPGCGCSCINNLEEKRIYNPCDPNCDDPPGCDFGLQHVCMGSRTWMVQDSFVFFDPLLGSSDTWKRVMLYNWDGRGGPIDDNDDCAIPGLCSFNSGWGNHIAAAPLLGNDTQVEFDSSVNNLLMAHARNSTNQLLVDCDGIPGGGVWVDNGAIEKNGCEWCFGSVAEGPTAFYSSESGLYYLIYSRNTWDSPAYQLVYRMTKTPTEAFYDLNLCADAVCPDYGGAIGIEEHILLRSDYPTCPRGVSFGHAEVIMIKDCIGTEHPFLVFHAKHHKSETRTVFFKELTVEEGGKLRRLYETYDTDKSRDIRYFRVPKCILEEGSISGGES